MYLNGKWIAFRNIYIFMHRCNFGLKVGYAWIVVVQKMATSPLKE